MVTMYKILMADGTYEDATLNFRVLFELNRKNKKLADRYFAIYKKLEKGDVNELEQVEFVYIAYVCAHLEDEAIMDLYEFAGAISDSREALIGTMRDLYGTTAPKGAPSAPPSKKRPRA